jgi:hypothetical protein
MPRHRAQGTEGELQRGAITSRLVRFFLGGDGQSPSNCPLSRRMPGVVLQRQRFGGLGDDFASASAAAIDTRMVGCFSGLVLLVELRTAADFYVIAAPEERHRSPSFVRKPQPFHGRRVAALCGRPAAWVFRKDEGYIEICFSCFRGDHISARRAELNLHRLGKCRTAGAPRCPRSRSAAFLRGPLSQAG